MPDDPNQGLFFPGEQAVGAAAATGPVDPSIEAAAAARTRVARKHFAFNRRVVIRWAGWGSILAILGGWTNGFLGFFYPHKTGAFGGTITAATTSELKVGEVKAITEGKFYLTHVPEGYIALWWKCPHLGCTVPWKENDPPEGQDVGRQEKGRFNCPCHGSIYDRYGQIIRGPAPRPMDRFPVTIDGDKIKVETGPTKAITRNAAGPDAAVNA
jgi:cytochrome b6-f complex iron-sulfur subunit